MSKPELLEHRLRVKVDALAQLDLTAMSRQTGFVLRELRKLDLAILVKAWLGLAGAGMPTLERILGAMTLLGHEAYSKQALSEHLRKPSHEFFATVLMALLWSDAHQVIRKGRLGVSGRIWVHDSTTLALPDRFAADFPGCVNQSRRTLSQLKLQCVFDLDKLELAQFSLSGFTRNDQAAAGDILAIAKAGDLVLRDLGYFVLTAFAAFREQSIHFLSRYRHRIPLFDPLTHKPLDLSKRLKRQPRLDLQVCLGADHVPVRRVALPVPPEIAHRRRRQAYRDRRARPSKESLFLMGWNLFVTDLSASQCPLKLIAESYRIRWTIEIIFKAWKSCLRLDRLNTHSRGMLRFSVLTQLLLCALTLDLCATLRHLRPPDRPPSILRVAAIIANHSGLIPCVVFQQPPARLLNALLIAQGSYERRRDRKKRGHPFRRPLPVRLTRMALGGPWKNHPSAFPNLGKPRPWQP